MKGDAPEPAEVRIAQPPRLSPVLAALLSACGLLGELLEGPLEELRKELLAE